MTQAVYEKITDRIISALEAGEIPWKKPWSGGSGGRPVNLKSGKPYKGINTVLLGFGHSYESPFWLTYKQAKAFGGWVKRGEKGTQIVFWNWSEKEVLNEKGEKDKRRFAFLKTYTVFNSEQCEHLCRSKILKEWEEAKANAKVKKFNPIKECEKIVAKYKGAPEVGHDGGDRAYYNILSDSIHLPKRELFDSEQEYYSTLFHEFAHSTGSKGRLGRDGIVGHRSHQAYSEEELVAEFAAAFLCGRAGIEPAIEKNSTAYIKGWLKTFKGDKKIALVAAAAAQKASDYVLGELEGWSFRGKSPKKKAVKKAVKKAKAKSKKVAKKAS